MQIQIPNKFETIPTKKDYAVGYYYRFFAKQSNNKYSEVYEISMDDYNRNLLNPMYRVLRMKMCISKDRDVALAVNNTVLRCAELVMPNIYGKYKNTLLKYWRDKSNMYNYENSLKLNYANIKYAVDNRNIHYSILSRKNIDFLENSDIFISKNDLEKYEMLMENINRYNEIQNKNLRFPEKVITASYLLKDILSISFTTELQVFFLTTSSAIIMTEQFIGINL